MLKLPIHLLKTSSSHCRVGIAMSMISFLMGIFFAQSSQATIQSPSAPVPDGKSEIDTQPAQRGHQRLAAEISNSAVKSLSCGAMLIAPVEKTVVKTPFAEVFVSEGTVSLIVSTDSTLTVYNLHDTKDNSVLIKIGTQSLSLRPMCMASMTSASLAGFAEINPAPFVAYRRLETKQLNDTYKLYRAEFNFYTMAAGLPALRQLTLVKAGPKQKALRDMLKTAVIMMECTSASEQFKYYLTPELRARLAAQ